MTARRTQAMSRSAASVLPGWAGGAGTAEQDPSRRLGLPMAVRGGGQPASCRPPVTTALMRPRRLDGDGGTQGHVGVNLRDLFPQHPLPPNWLDGKRIAIDGHNV